MRFSVIIPCYNASRSIERALDSVFFQTFMDLEAICIDDGSEDNTLDVIKAYLEKHKESKITLICNEKNCGPGVSRNNGIAIAKGEFLMFLDADDYYDLSTFDVLDRKLAQTNADIVFYGCNQIIGNTIRKRPVTARNSISDYLALVGGSLCGAAWRRNLWESISIPPISNAEDIAVIPVLISRAKIIYTVDDLLYNYVHSNSSVSNHHLPQVSHNFVQSFHYTLQHVDISKYFDSLEFHGIKTIIYGATLNALKAGMTRKDILEIWNEFESLFPNWINDKYLNSYSRIKRIFVHMAAQRWFVFMRVYAYLHNIILKQFG